MREGSRPKPATLCQAATAPRLLAEAPVAGDYSGACRLPSYPLARNAAISGNRVAASAGTSPPTAPIVGPSSPALTMTSRVTANWKAMRVLFAPNVLACQPLKTSQDTVNPMMTPQSAMNSASIQIAPKAATRLKPSARAVAISTLRSDTELIIVFSAPAVAPKAISSAIGQPNNRIRSAVREDCPANS